MDAQTEQIFYRDEQSAIPIDIAIHTIQRMQYASIERVGMILLFLTGCRVCELNNMKITNLWGNKLFWKPAKSQKGKPRVVILSPEIINEISQMRLRYGAKETILPIDAETFRRYFTKNRSKLGIEWQEKVAFPKQGRVTWEYKLQLKGFRKLYSTKLFAEKMKEWNNAEIGLIFASKELRHSTTRMTAHYYLIKDFNKLGINKYLSMKMTDILKINNQKTLLEY